MKILGRVLFALLCVILFIFTLNYSEQIRVSKYFEKYGTEALEEAKEDPTAYRFFYGTTGYHKNAPLYTITNGEYTIYFYEVVTLEQNKSQEKRVNTYLYTIVTSKTKPLTKKGNQLLLRFKDTSIEVENETYDKSYGDFSVVRFRNLDLFVAVNEEIRIHIVKDEFVNKNFDLVELYFVDEARNFDKLLSEPIMINEEDFTIAEKVLDYHNSPNTLVYTYNIFPKQIHVMKEYDYIFYISTSLVLVLIGIMTYFTYFFRRKRKYTE
ncbi:MAG: hypothetical protein ACOX02_03610 [Acholeplasmatales bacterium]